MAARRGRAKSPENRCLDRPTWLTGRIDNVAEFPGRSNRDEEAQKKNPGALAGATGDQGVSHTGENSRRQAQDATFLTASPRHRSAATMMLACLALNGGRPELWRDCAMVLHVRLTSAELIGLAFAALRALDPDLREDAFCAAHWGEMARAGSPLPPLTDVMGEARWWASVASTRERKAYALAAFEALDVADRAAFLAHVTGSAEERRAP